MTTRRSLPIPFLPLKRIRVEPQQVVMKARLYNPRMEPSPQEKALQQREAEARRKARQQYERDHLMTAPFRDGNQKIVGVLGVIGPTRLNYARIVPMVDFTARVVSRLLERGRG